MIDMLIQYTNCNLEFVFTKCILDENLNTNPLVDKKYIYFQLKRLTLYLNDFRDK